MSYQSPIEVIFKGMETKVENDMVKCVQHYGFNVDKPELKRALMYDRQQYDKGYRDGQKAAKRTAEWVHLEDGKEKCSACETEYTHDDDDFFWYFCPYCGAEM